MSAKQGKSKSQNIWFLITTVLMFFLVAVYGFNKAAWKAKGVTEGYKANITLKETVVLDDQHTVKRYGGPVTLEAGTVGEILEIVDWFTEKHEFEHIRASFSVDEGNEISVILGYEMEREADTGIFVDAYNAIFISQSKNEKARNNIINSEIPVININKINDSQKITSEFKEMYARYHQRVKQTLDKGSIIGAVYAFVIVAAVWLIKIFIRKEKAGKVLLIATICFDALMILVDWASIYMTLAMA